MKVVTVNNHRITFYNPKDVPIVDDNTITLYNGTLKELPVDIASKVADRVYWEGVEYNLYIDHHSTNSNSAWRNPTKSLASGTDYTHVLIQL